MKMKMMLIKLAFMMTAVSVTAATCSGDEPDEEDAGLTEFEKLYQDGCGPCGTIATGEQALALGPNNAEVHAMVAVNKFYAGKYQEAIELLKKAMRLHPHYPAWYPHYLGKAYTQTQQYDLALAAFSDVLARAPHQDWGHFGNAIVYVRLGRLEEARNHVENALALNPQMTLDTFAAGDGFYKDPKTLEGILDDLRQAGLK